MSDIVLDFEQPIAELEKKIESLRNSSENGGVDFSGEIEDLENKKEQLKLQIYQNLDSWQRVQLARHPRRPYTEDYIKIIFEDFIELHGDRCYGDDNAITAGIATIDSSPVVVIGHQKGRNLQENIDHNFGMAHPEGYRKALRVMKLAEKFNRPIITFIDTAGAYPGIAAEERGQAEAIARSLREMSALTVPVISVIIGEGGSGGALGIGIANKVLILENSYYSVISPEGCAAILFRDAARSKDAAEALKITAKDLLNLKVVDEIIKEPVGGAHVDPVATAMNIKTALNAYISKLSKMSETAIADDRYEKFRNMGVFEGGGAKQSKPKAKAAAKTSKKK
ncbi:MAG: acetyl-CoA carboxylase carboxyltransferase subunit alpha [Elusimicrobia bacterium]|nr:acetyl-CoA carboxylase carboxyltransferase subunit alpha [Elusimicrobiota bacterium]